jgi:hypothetical protein
MEKDIIMPKIQIRRGNFEDIKNLIIDVGEPCYIIDKELHLTGNGTSSIEELYQNYLNNEKANKIDVLTKSQITNCLLEVPQRIKLELNNGVLTLKAGSQVIVPNGFEADGVTRKFEYKTLATDVSRTGEGNTPALLPLFMQTTDMKLGYSMEHFSGDTDPKGLSAETFKLWYDTKNNIVKVTSDGGNTWVANSYSLPFALISLVNQISAINQTFNGFGYIGSTIWVDKGVKGLIPNGRNEDGTLRNTEITTQNVLTQTASNTYNFKLIFTATACASSSICEYSEKDNLNINVIDGSTVHAVIAGTFTRTAGVVSNFQPKQPFRAVDYNDKSEISGWAMPSDKYIDLALGASGTSYTAPANGWVALRKKATASGQYMAVGLNITNFNNTCYATASGQALSVIAPVSKNAKIYVAYNLGGETLSFKFYYAEGEQ